MTGKRLYWMGLFVAVAGLVVSSGDAEARCGCRTRTNGMGLGWRHNNAAYASNNNGYYTNNGYYAPNGYFPNSNTTTTVVNGQPMNQGTTYSTSKPVLVNQPAPAYNSPPNNPSPDVDNSERNLTTSSIPGTQPAKAPAPAAAAAPRAE